MIPLKIPPIFLNARSHGYSFFSFKGKFTPLEAVNDSVVFNVYDEVIIEADGNRSTVEPNSTIQRIERRLLGGFEVPFSTVYLNGKVRFFTDSGN